MWQNNPDHFQQPTPRPTMRTQCHLRSEIWGTWERTLLRSLTNRQSKVKRLHPNIHSSRMGTMTRASSVMRMQHTVKFLLKSGETWWESMVSKTKFRNAMSCIWPLRVPPFPKPTRPARTWARSKPHKIVKFCSFGGVKSFKLCCKISVVMGKSSTNIPPNILGCESSAALRLFTKTKLNALKKKRAHGGTGQNKTRFY